MSWVPPETMRAALKAAWRAAEQSVVLSAYSAEPDDVQLTIRIAMPAPGDTGWHIIRLHHCAGIVGGGGCGLPTPEATAAVIGRDGINGPDPGGSRAACSGNVPQSYGSGDGLK